MAKISPVSAKYIVHAGIQIEGVVDKPDVIGAVFGQTEGLLGADLELRELQRSGRIGRIEVTVETKSGKTNGTILIPSSLDKAETAIVGASLEIIQRIGPCNAKILVKNIEDVRVSKRQFVIDRAKQLLKNLMDKVMPDSQELADEVAYSVRVMEIREYGKDRLPAGPNIDEGDEIIIVEGRADVINLLKHGFKNVIAINGTSVPETIVNLCKQKIVTVFTDGDRGGNLIIKEIMSVADIDFVTKAPDGKEVEEITKKEIHKALRSKVAPEQAKMEFKLDATTESMNGNKRQQYRKPEQRKPYQRSSYQRPNYQSQRQPNKQHVPKIVLNDKQKKSFKQMLEDLIGTRGSYVLDEKLNILGKVPISEIPSTIANLGTNVYAVVFDGSISKDLVRAIEKNQNVKFVVGMDSKVNSRETKLNIVTLGEL
tara:strand:+ start:9225 stop:10505 length:1281 start_codon:yes stop_codon:yes gene_type:complete